MSMFRPSGFDRIPPVVKNLLIINCIMLLASWVTSRMPGGVDLDAILGLHYWKSELFRPWQLVTYLFMHGGIWHLVSNMIALWIFGSLLESRWGSQRFLLFYLVCGVGAGICHLLVLHFQMAPVIHEFNTVKSQLLNAPPEVASQYLRPYRDYINQTTVGASGAIFGLLFAFGYLFPDMEVYLYFAIPIKAKWFVMIYAALELYAGIQSSAGDNVAHFAHLGGLVFAFLLLKIWGMRYGGNQWRRY